VLWFTSTHMSESEPAKSSTMYITSDISSSSKAYINSRCAAIASLCPFRCLVCQVVVDIVLGLQHYRNPKTIRRFGRLVLSFGDLRARLRVPYVLILFTLEVVRRAQCCVVQCSYFYLCLSTNTLGCVRRHVGRAQLAQITKAQAFNTLLRVCTLKRRRTFRLSCASRQVLRLCTNTGDVLSSILFVVSAESDSLLHTFIEIGLLEFVILPQSVSYFF